MRHRMSSRKLGRNTAHRLAMYRNLVTSLLDHEKVETTHAKAQGLKRIADKMITLGKRGDLHARRQAMAVVREKGVTAKLFDELAPRYAGRNGGYTRVLRTRRRVGDAAEMSIVALVEGDVAAAPDAAPKKTKKKAAGAKAPAKKAATKKAPAKKAATKKKAATRKSTSKKARTKKAASKKKSAGKKKSTKSKSD
jgi:large subunit ribosomal protein L17